MSATYRTIILAVAIIAFVTGGASAAPATERKAERLNIIFYLTDDMRWDAMGCEGNRIIHTPNLDELAGQGVRFTNMFCTTSICATSRASFLTGQYARRHQINDFGTTLSPEAFADTFPAVLRRQGYHTAFVGKWGLGGELPEKEFDFWAGYSGQGRYFEKDDPEHLTSKLTKQALRFLKAAPDNKPFLLCISSKAPHCQDRAEHQFQPDPRFADLYKGATIPSPVTATTKAFDALPGFLQKSEGRIRWHRRFATPEMHQASVKDYYRLISGVDHSLGQVVEQLKASGQFDRTIIIFTSDNGFFLGEHGLAGKWYMHEESIRLPLIVRHPRFPKATPDAMVLTIDIAPTIMELADARIPAGVQGKSLAPLLKGEKTPWRTEWFYEHHYGHRGRIPKSEGVRTPRWKYVRYIDPQPPVEQLFDLQSDPHEQKDLARDSAHAKKLEEMRARWRRLAAAAK